MPKELNRVHRENWSTKPSGKLFTGKTMRVYNYNIVSKGHTNMTVKQNKLALSPFDSKSFLLFDGISTVPFGRKAAEENAFL